MTIPISLRERFLGLPNPLGGNFAPSTLGAAQYTHPVDYKEFKHDKNQKLEKKIMKTLHKKELLKAYPLGIGKKLNIPAKSLPETVKMQF